MEDLRGIAQWRFREFRPEKINCTWNPENFPAGGLRPPGRSRGVFSGSLLKSFPPPQGRTQRKHILYGALLLVEILSAERQVW